MRQRLRFATLCPGRVLDNHTRSDYNQGQKCGEGHCGEDPHAAIEIHAIDTNGRVVFDPQIDVLANTKAKVAGRRKVFLPQLIFLDFEPAFKDFLGLGPSYSNVYSDLLVPADAKCSHSVPRLA